MGNFLAENIRELNKLGCSARTVTKIILLLMVFVVTIEAIFKVDWPARSAFCSVLLAHR